MKLGEIKLGGTYLVDLSGNDKLEKVRLIREAAEFGWLGQTEGSTALVLIASASQIRARFGGPAPKPVPAPESPVTRVSPPGPSKRPRPLRVAAEVSLEEIPAPAKMAVSGEPQALKLSDLLKQSRTLTPSKEVPPHLVVTARAGTGKTFTLIEGLRRIMDRPTPGVTGSPQQEEVWAAMQSGPRPSSAQFVAFNRSIAKELGAKVPRGCQASTLHGMGFSACQKAYKLKREDVNQYKVQDLLELVDGRDIRQLRKQHGLYVQGITRLVGLCKMTLTEPTEENLDELAGRFEVELQGYRSKVYEMVPRILQECRERTHSVDFDDMVWLPVVNNLPVWRNDLLLVDECQDLNRCQQALAMKAGRRLILCGDPRQAIYGFAGADTESIPRMVSTLKESSQGCEVLPLTVTRRCGHAIVTLAKGIVPDFEAYATNPAGSIGTVKQKDLPGVLRDGDMVLCRMNAPLVSLVFQLIRAGRKANIQGRNIGEQLIDFIASLKAVSVDHLLENLDAYSFRETNRINAARNPSEGALIALQDKCECVKAFCEGSAHLPDVTVKIEAVFSDEQTSGILLSSIHRAKGLEAKRVFILCPDKLPHPMAKTESARQQEQNLRYVAITRAIEELWWVEPEPEEKEEGRQSRARGHFPDDHSG